jgi:GR25 family glycosyltransferase involved in LPS biosynthesis
MIDLYKYFEKICYINLEEDKKKKEYFEKEILKSQFLSKMCHRYEAVIGKYLDIRLVPDAIVTPKAKNDIIAKKQKSYGISLTYGSLACALSHHLIYQECQNSHKPFFVFEDDIIIDENFDRDLSNVLDMVQSSRYSYDILYLGYNEIPGFQKKVINDIISEPRGLITGLYGYIVSSKGAKKLLDTIFPLYKQIDSCISDNRDKFELLCSTKNIIHVKTDFGSKTQLDASCKNIHNDITAYSEWYKLFQ